MLQRIKYERCQAALRAAGIDGKDRSRLRSPPSPCSKKDPPRLHKMLAMNQLDSMPPLPMANGPLFAMSRSLASLIAHHAVPEEWLEALKRTEAVKYHSRTGLVRFALRISCSSICSMGMP